MKQRVLIVEDSLNIARHLKSLVESETHFSVDLVGTYAKAREAIQNHADEYFVATLDLILPDAPNAEVVDFALANDVPSIVFTSTISNQIRSSLLSKNVIDYVIKNKQGFSAMAHLIKRLDRNRNTRVLVVDDSPLMRRQLRSLLKIYMFNVVLASKADTAMQLLKKYEDITMAIIDYSMPGTDGIELTARMRETYTKDQLSIIGISGIDADKLSVNFIKNGANDFIKKPFEREEFYCRVVQNQEMLESIAELRELNDLKNKFMGMAAHDLRNPINGIKGFSELLMDEFEGAEDSEHAEIMGMIYHESKHMLDLVNDMLDVSVIESGWLELEFSSVRLDELVEERVRIIQIGANAKRIKVVTELEKVTMEMDDKRVAQVIDNLLSNAIKFSPRDTTVTVSVRSVENRVVVRVSDQGPGLSSDQQAHVFESFRKGGPRPTAGESSTGLGLFIVKKIIETHGGKVWIESTVNQGATFCFYLPLVLKCPIPPQCD